MQSGRSPDWLPGTAKPRAVAGVLGRSCTTIITLAGILARRCSGLRESGVWPSQREFGAGESGQTALCRRPARWPRLHEPGSAAGSLPMHAIFLGIPSGGKSGIIWHHPNRKYPRKPSASIPTGA